jgi:hypothetical protein
MSKTNDAVKIINNRYVKLKKFQTVVENTILFGIC